MRCSDWSSDVCSSDLAFQAAVSRASGIELALDGDLLRPGASLDDPGATERAVRALRLDMGDAAIRRALEKGDAAEFEDTDLYARVFALADAAEGKQQPRAVLPGIRLEDRKSGGEGKRVSARVDLGGCGYLTKTRNKHKN